MRYLLCDLQFLDEEGIGVGVGDGVLDSPNCKLLYDNLASLHARSACDEAFYFYFYQWYYFVEKKTVLFYFILYI